MVRVRVPVTTADVLSSASVVVRVTVTMSGKGLRVVWTTSAPSHVAEGTSVEVEAMAMHVLPFRLVHW